MKRLHVDLFSGIGGFSLAAEAQGVETAAFAETDEYASRILARHWPNVPNYGDVRRDWGDYAGRVWLVTGGPPCQPYSSAGKRLGRADPRDRWPAMLAAVRTIRPDWVLVENVAGIRSMALSGWEDDLEACGYQHAAFDIRACAVGLPTLERHIWLVAARAGLELARGGEERLPFIQASQIRQRALHDSGAPRMPIRRDLPRPRLRRSREGIPCFVDRIRCLGNAVPPQLAAVIIGAMVASENREKGKP